MPFARVILGYDGSARSLGAADGARAAADAFHRPLLAVRVDDGSDDEAVPVDDLEVVQLDGADAPATGLIHQVRATTPPGLLCLATRGRGALGELLLGSVASQVVRELGQPLLVTGPAIAPIERPWQRLLVCLDGSATADSILPTARQWARALGLQVLLVHVAYPSAGPYLGAEEDHSPTRLILQHLHGVADELRADGLEARVDLVEDTSPARGILRASTELMADVVAMSTHGRTGLARLLLGSVATEVIRRLPVPVLVRRPQQWPAR